MSVLVAGAIACASWSSAALTTATVDFEPEDVRLEASRSFQSISIDGCTHLSEVGQPDLPVMILRFVVPTDMRVDGVLITRLEEEELAGEHRVSPAQRQVHPGETPEWTDADPSTYGSDALYPASRVEYLGEGYLGGYRIASVAVSPLQYAPASGHLMLASEMSIALELVPASNRALPRQRMTADADETYRRVVKSLVENPEDVSACRSLPAVSAEAEGGGFVPRERPSLEGSPVEYVIITGDALESRFQELADRKTRKGVPAVVRTVSWIEENYAGGADLAERVRFFIQDAYESWGTVYVLLGGDTDVVPVRYAWSRYGGGALLPSDLYYSSLEGDWNDDGDELFGEGYYGVTVPGDSVDLYPDVFVGRAPVSDIVETETFLSKCEAYVREPEPDFTDRNLALAEVVFPYDWESGDYSLDGAADIVEPALSLFPDHTELTRLYANTAEFPDAGLLNSDSAMESLNAGYNIAVHVGHGSRDIMRVNLNNYITMSDVSSLSNGLSKSSFLWLLNCSTAAVDYDCIAERALNNPNGGAVGAFGATRPEYPGTTREYLWEWLDLLYTHSVYRAGETAALAKAAFASPEISGSENTHRWTQLTMILMGDPELPLWTARATGLTASHTGSIGVGEGELAVTVTDDSGPVENALVCVVKDGEVYERGLTDAAGAVSLIIKPDTPGSLGVTVTAANHIVSESTIEVLAAPGPHVFLESVVVDDTGARDGDGNGNGQVEAGESSGLDIDVGNGGEEQADSITATLSSSDFYVTIEDDIESFATIPAGAAVSALSAFRFTAASTCPDGHDAAFTILFSDGSGGVWTDDFLVRVHAPELDCLITHVDDSAGDGDGVPEVGETVELTVEIRNTGSGDAEAVTGSLSFPSGSITVTDGSESWGDVGSGATVIGANGFGLTVNEQPTERLRLELSDSHGAVWTFYLDLERPNAPTAVTASVKSTTIVVTWPPVSAPDLRGYTIHRSQSAVGPFERTGEGIVESGSYFADSGLPENTLFYYYVTAVDSSGNQSEPTEILPVSTNPPSLVGWPLGTGGGMYSSPAVADLDGDGTFEVIVASEHIYAWHADGFEVVDGDADARTSGIFETDGQGGYRCSPAVGDVDGDRGLEIVAAAWADVSGVDAGIYEVFVWNAEDGSVLPGWPVVTRKFCWASPALADLDGDGRAEVVIACADGNLYCWNHDGTEYIDGDGIPATEGVFASLGGSWVYGSTAVADLDGDDVLELIQPSTNDSIYAFHADGSRVEGWPVFVEARSMCSPAVGDVDGDGDLEVVVGSGASKFWLLESDGTVMDGWPRTATVEGDFPPSPVLADVDGDGDLEVVIAGKTGSIVVYDYLGNQLPGWPVDLDSDTCSSPVVADLDDDPDMEILIGCHSGKVYAFDADGEILAGWPIQTGAEVIASASVCDLDGDGDNEVIVGGMDTNVYVWDCAGNYDGGDGVEWGAFLHDSWRTQLYEFKVPTAVDDGDDGPLGLPMFALEQNCPNPFNPVTTIGFTVPQGEGAEANVSLAIYGVDGSLVRTLVRGRETRGRHSVVWDGRDASGRRVASGVYFYRLAHDEGVESRSMVLMK